MSIKLQIRLVAQEFMVLFISNAAIGIVPIDHEGNTWLVGQYRYTLNAFSWEIPEGGCQLDKETPLSSAQRELLEETGLVAQKTAIGS